MMEGQELRAATRVWQDQAASESRLELMSEVMRVNVGFADLQIFNLGITNKLRSEAMKLRGVATISLLISPRTGGFLNYFFLNSNGYVFIM